MIRRTLAPALLACLAMGAFACSGDDDDDTNPPARDAGQPARDAGVVERDGGETERDGGEAERDGGVDRDGGGPRDGGGGRDGGPPDFRIPGTTAPVTVKFDDVGMLHVRCQTDADCFAAQGYFHAAHRFPQMDIRRRFASGRLAEVFGIIALDNDRALRHLIATRTGQPMAEVLWQNASMETQAMVTAYTRGVNAWIDDLRNNRNGADVPPEYLAYRNQITDWQEIDSVACILALIESLTNNSGTEITMGELFGQLPAPLALDAFGLGPGSASTIQPMAGFTTPRPDHEQQRIAGEAVRGRLEHAQGALAAAHRPGRLINPVEDRGSNNWVLAPSRAAGNGALFANDPHLGMTQPSVWYVVSIDSKTAGGNIHVAGASFAGLPGIILGQNEDIAWGATVAFFDHADVYIETLNMAGDAVMFNGQPVPIQNVDFTFDVFGGQPITESFPYVPHHGPVLSMDAAMGTAVTVRWTGADATTDLNFLWTMMNAGSVTEARTALRNSTTIGQNFVVIDRAGSIGWFPYNQVPNRPWNSAMLPSWLPLPGDGTAEWQGVIPYEDLPQSLDPMSGAIATANNDMTGHLWDGDPTNDGQAAAQTFVAVGYRHERIMERINDGGNTHTVATMQDIQADTHSLFGETIVPIVLAEATTGSANLDANGMLVQRALTAWTYTCPTGLIGNQPDGPPDPAPTVASESAGCAAFHALWPRLSRATFSDELDQNMVSRAARDSAVIRLFTDSSLLMGGETYWDDVTTRVTETRTMQITQAMNDAGAWLTANLGATIDEWRWGRVHTVTLSYDLLSSLTDRFNVGPYCNDGGAYTVDVANPGGAFSDNFAHGSGPSMRLACEADPAAMSCTIELPGGQSSFPTSPHYEDMLQLWLENTPTAIPFTPAEVDTAAVSEFMITAP